MKKDDIVDDYIQYLPYVTKKVGYQPLPCRRCCIFMSKKLILA